MKKVKLLTLLMSVVLLFSLCACGETVTSSQTDNTPLLFENIISLDKSQVTEVKILSMDRGRQGTFAKGTEEYSTALELFFGKKFICKGEVQSTLEVLDGGMDLISFCDAKGGSISIEIVQSTFEYNGKVYEEIPTSTDAMQFINNVKITKPLDHYGSLRLHVPKEDLVKVTVEDIQAKKCVTIISSENMNKIFDAFDESYDNYEYVDDFKPEQHRYKVTFEFVDGANTINNFIFFDEMKGNTFYYRDNAKVYAEKDIDWSVFTELDWNKAEDIKE
ncbi:MAG: hypothetical protein IJ462_03980 [Clostridia bacterium]|nr:hypothetical protein [Clostridia bacterium]